MTNAIEALHTVFLLLVFALIWLGPWQWAISDRCRRILFEKRDELFDLAADGYLSFDSTEYRTIRISLENSIRFAHSMTLFRVGFFYLFRPKSLDMEKLPNIRIAVQQIRNEAAKAKVQKLVEEAGRAMTISLCLKSPLVFGLTMLVLWISLPKRKKFTDVVYTEAECLAV
jgi:hypothetical protein